MPQAAIVILPPNKLPSLEPSESTSRRIEKGDICGTQCSRLGHGGTWQGWLRMGHASVYNDKAYWP